MTLAWTFDLDLQSPASYCHDVLTCKSSRSTVSWFQRQSENKWMDGRTDAGDCISCQTDRQINRPTNILTQTKDGHIERQRQTNHGIAVVTAEDNDVNRRRVIGYTDSSSPCTVLPMHICMHMRFHTITQTMFVYGASV